MITAAAGNGRLWCGLELAITVDWLLRLLRLLLQLAGCGSDWKGSRHRAQWDVGLRLWPRPRRRLRGKQLAEAGNEVQLLLLRLLLMPPLLLPQLLLLRVLQLLLHVLQLLLHMVHSGSQGSRGRRLLLRRRRQQALRRLIEQAQQLRQEGVLLRLLLLRLLRLLLLLLLLWPACLQRQQRMKQLLLRLLSLLRCQGGSHHLLH
jgi:hypothetical protein